jgi:hypothetical protein
MRYVSDELFHFVGKRNPLDHETNYQTLLKVLDSRCVSHPPHNPDISQYNISFNWDKILLTEEMIVPTVTCFCDIPFESLKIHIQKYGKFGVSFSRNFLIKYGARPVIYIPLHRNNFLSIHGINMLNDLEQVYRGFQEQVIEPISKPIWSSTMGEKPNSSEDACLSIDSILTKEFLSYLKPFDAELPDEHPDNFYLEREWRKFGNLPFQVTEIQNVLVAKEYAQKLESERPVYSDKIRVVDNW